VLVYAGRLERDLSEKDKREMLKRFALHVRVTSRDKNTFRPVLSEENSIDYSAPRSSIRMRRPARHKPTNWSFRSSLHVPPRRGR
jgi:hypothetical protein